jgi:hypothetical protein
MLSTVKMTGLPKSGFISMPLERREFGLTATFPTQFALLGNDTEQRLIGKRSEAPMLKSGQLKMVRRAVLYPLLTQQ